MSLERLLAKKKKDQSKAAVNPLTRKANQIKDRPGMGAQALVGNLNRAKKGELLEVLDVSIIKRGRYQPRINIDPDSLLELADSIRAQGVVQPIVVRPDGEFFELIAGERRWRAAQMAGLDAIPAAVRNITDQMAAAMSLVENIQREDLNPLEEAEAAKRLMSEFGFNQKELSKTLGKSTRWVSERFSLLKLPEKIKYQVGEGQLSMTKALRDNPVSPGKSGGGEATPQESAQSEETKAKKPQERNIGIPVSVLSASLKEMAQLADVLGLEPIAYNSRTSHKEMQELFVTRIQEVLRAAREGKPATG